MQLIDLFDTHSHLQDPTFDRDRAAVIDRATAAGVFQIVAVAEDMASSHHAIQLAQTTPSLWATVGVHPHNARAATAELAEWITELAASPRVVAIGEIGLDYHYDRSPRPDQRAVFNRQLAVAASLALPVAIHSRSALDDTVAILGEWSRHVRVAGAHDPLGVMHCFGYDRVAAERFVALGFMVSIPGTVTFPKADTVKDVARWLPDDALVLETDAPVLAPQGHRGRRNEPAYLRETAEGVAALRGTSLAMLASLTSANARRLYRLSDTGPNAAGVTDRPA